MEEVTYNINAKMLNYTRMSKKQLIFTDKSMRKKNVNEAKKNKDEKNEIRSNILWGRYLNSYILCKRRIHFL